MGRVDISRKWSGKDVYCLSQSRLLSFGGRGASVQDLDQKRQARNWGEKTWPNFYCRMPTVWPHLCVQLWAAFSPTAITDVFVARDGHPWWWYSLISLNSLWECDRTDVLQCEKRIKTINTLIESWSSPGDVFSSYLMIFPTILSSFRQSGSQLLLAWTPQGSPLSISIQFNILF